MGGDVSHFPAWQVGTFLPFPTFATGLAHCIGGG